MSSTWVRIGTYKPFKDKKDEQYMGEKRYKPNPCLPWNGTESTSVGLFLKYTHLLLASNLFSGQKVKEKYQKQDWPVPFLLDLFVDSVIGSKIRNYRVLLSQEFIIAHRKKYLWNILFFLSQCDPSLPLLLLHLFSSKKGLTCRSSLHRA